VVYADFECLTKPIESCKPNSEHSFTEQYQKHEPSGFCFNIVCDGKKLKPVLYPKKSTDENIGEIFCKHLKNEIDKVWTSEAKDMIFKEEDKANFETSANRWICRKDFERVRTFRTLAGFKFWTKPRHRLTMQQGDKQRCWETRRGPGEDKGLWGTSARKCACDVINCRGISIILLTDKIGIFER